MPTKSGNYYTGQYFDKETGLYYYGARYYNPRVGQFTTADTIVSNPALSQSFNRYSYVQNNPLNFTDPTGHISEISLGRIVVTKQIDYLTPFTDFQYSFLENTVQMVISSPQSFIPVYGSLEASINDFQTGHPVWGTVNAGLTVVDMFAVGALGRGAVTAISRSGIAQQFAQSFNRVLTSEAGFARIGKSSEKIFVIGESAGTSRVKDEALKIGGKFYEARSDGRVIGFSQALKNNYQAMRRRFLEGYKLKDIGLHPNPKRTGTGNFYPWEQRWKKLWGWKDK